MSCLRLVGRLDAVTDELEPAVEPARLHRAESALHVAHHLEQEGVAEEQRAGRYTVVVDPIDGSQNAERGIPYYGLCVAVADGETVDDVFFGYVYDFGANEEWYAARGGGAFLNGAPLTGAPKDEIEIVSPRQGG